MEDTNKKIRQPNHISTARFSLSVMEMNIMYLIVDSLQKKLDNDFNSTYKEEQITIELSKIDKNNNYSRVKSAVKSLMTKSVEFVYNLPDSTKISESSTVIVSGYEHIKQTHYITIDVPAKISKFLCYIGGGYTAFQKTIAISLNSVYSKKMYELCCRFHDRGGYNNSILKFKEYLNITDKYKKISHLKSKVLETAKYELKLKADFYFSYSLSKERRSFNKISIKIHTNVAVNKKYIGFQQKTYSFVYTFLCRFFPTYIDNSALFYTDNLALNGTLETAKNRFQRLDDDISFGRKTKADVLNLLKKIILKELGAFKSSQKEKTTQLKLSGF